MSIWDSFKSAIGLDLDKPWYTQFEAPPVNPLTTVNVGGGNNQSQNQDSSPSQAELLQSARNRRANALKSKKNELTKAFGAFGDDYYSDMSDSYKEFVSDDLDTGYDDALRGIYQGFKARGIMPYAELNAAIADLDKAKAIEMDNINKGAMGYSQSKKEEVSKSQKTLGDQLSALVGGASSVADIDKQTKAIEEFNIANKVAKLQTPSAKETMSFFADYDKLAENDVMGANVAPTYGSGKDASSMMKMGSVETPRRSFGIDTPFSGGSMRNVG